MSRLILQRRQCESRACCGTQQSLLLLLTSVMTLIVILPTSAHACSVCGGDPASPMTAGMNSAIWALLAITGTVVSSVIGFFLFLWRRARHAKSVPIDSAWLEGLRGVKE